MIKSFLFAGIVCMIASIIKDKTNLTNGHITCLFVVIGAFLGFLGIYDKLIEIFGAGASVTITSFGNSLYKSAVEDGILRMLNGGSIGIVSAILMGFIVTLIFKVKD